VKNKWLIIGIAIAVIAAGILIAVNVGRETIMSQPNALTVPAVSTPTESTPVQTLPAVKGPEIQMVVLTVEELLNQIIQNPNKYKAIYDEGGGKPKEDATVIQVTGVALDVPRPWSGHLGPKVQGWRVEYSPSNNRDFALVWNDDVITIQGTLEQVNQRGKLVVLRDCSLISREKK